MYVEMSIRYYELFSDYQVKTFNQMTHHLSYSEYDKHDINTDGGSDWIINMKKPKPYHCWFFLNSVRTGYMFSKAVYVSSLT